MNAFLYPLKLSYIPKQALWGGDTLIKQYGKTAPFPAIAETWELSASAGADCTVENGACAGMRLSEYIQKYNRDILSREAVLSLLVKWIDARERLSVQVHPDDAFARRVEQKSGKTELWYVASAADGAEIIYGLQGDVSMEAFRDAARRGEDLLPFLNVVKVRQGDVFFIPAGMVHAIGGGVVIAEIQQNSDVTYRLFDYRRKDANGKERELHIEKSLAALRHDTPARIEALRFREKREDCLAFCDHFRVFRYEIGAERSFSADAHFHSVLCLEGRGKIECGARSDPIRIGDSYFIPRGCGEYRLKAEERLSVLLSYY